MFKNLYYYFLLFFMTIACTSGINTENIKVKTEKELISGQNLEIFYDDYYEFDQVKVALKSNRTKKIIEDYGSQIYKSSFYINRFLKKDINYNDSYYFQVDFIGENNFETRTVDINVNPSIIIESFCATENCNTLSGNIVQNTINTLKVKAYYHNFPADKYSLEKHIDYNDA